MLNSDGSLSPNIVKYIAGALGLIGLVLLFTLTPKDSSSTAAQQQGPTLVRDVVDHDGVYGPITSPAIHVGDRIHITEAMTDEGWAQALTLARAVGNRSGVETAYGEDSYRDYRPNGVTCKVVDQPQRDWADGIACLPQSGDDAGTTVYATVIDN